MPDILINSTLWSPIEEEYGTAIKNILVENKLITAEDRIIGTDAPPDIVMRAPEVGVAAISFCKIACGVAEAAAVAACSLLAPPAIPACVAVAHVAGDLCRQACDD